MHNVGRRDLASLLAEAQSNDAWLDAVIAAMLADTPLPPWPRRTLYRARHRMRRLVRRYGFPLLLALATAVWWSTVGTVAYMLATTR